MSEQTTDYVDDRPHTLQEHVKHYFRTTQKRTLGLSFVIMMLSLIWMIPKLPVEGLMSAIGVAAIYFVTMIVAVLVLQPFVGLFERRVLKMGKE